MRSMNGPKRLAWGLVLGVLALPSTTAQAQSTAPLVCSTSSKDAETTIHLRGNDAKAMQFVVSVSYGWSNGPAPARGKALLQANAIADEGCELWASLRNVNAKTDLRVFLDVKRSVSPLSLATGTLKLNAYVLGTYRGSAMHFPSEEMSDGASSPAFYRTLTCEMRPSLLKAISACQGYFAVKDTDGR